MQTRPERLSVRSPTSLPLYFTTILNTISFASVGKANEHNQASKALPTLNRLTNPSAGSERILGFPYSCGKRLPFCSVRLPDLITTCITSSSSRDLNVVLKFRSLSLADSPLKKKIEF